MEDINALELLKEEMSTEEIYLKVNAIHRLKIVVLCLGPSDTQNLLLPYLESKKIENLKFIFFRSHKLRRRWSTFCYRGGTWKSLGTSLWQNTLLAPLGETSQIRRDCCTRTVSAVSYCNFWSAIWLWDLKCFYPTCYSSCLSRMVHRPRFFMLFVFPRISTLWCIKRASPQKVHGTMSRGHSYD